jgi:hypothetical protein
VDVDRDKPLRAKGFKERVQKFLLEPELEELEEFLLLHPNTGLPIPGVPGLRETRWKGTFGTATILFFYKYGAPPRLYMLAAFPEGADLNMSENERQELKKILEAL